MAGRAYGMLAFLFLGVAGRGGRGAHSPVCMCGCVTHSNRLMESICMHTLRFEKGHKVSLNS